MLKPLSRAKTGSKPEFKHDLVQHLDCHGLENLTAHKERGEAFRLHLLSPLKQLKTRPTEAVFKSYRLILDEIEKEPGTKRVLGSIENTTCTGHIPPRYPHPLKEFFQKYRKGHVMAGVNPPNPLTPVKPMKGAKR